MNPPLDQLPMRRDPSFNQGGSYQFVIEKNIVAHREAIEQGFQIIIKHFGPSTEKKLKILDLACGGTPIIIAEIMARLDRCRFVYSGIDLNPDQIAACKKFPFPKNVTVNQIIEGNAWTLENFSSEKDYDLVFVGLNMHHGIPEEIFYTARQIYGRLRPGGLFLNHDIYRPSRYPYLRRPGKNFVSEQKLKAACILTPFSPEFRGAIQHSWREEWFRLHEFYLKKAGASAELTQEVITHMRLQDYPVSLQEMAMILGKVGFRTTLYDYLKTDHPEAEFFGMVAAVS